MTAERALHLRQAEALRQLADIIEQNPELAHMLRYGCEGISIPLLDDVRATLAEFHRIMRTAGVSVSVDNNATSCDVFADLGAVKVRMYAMAERMAGETGHIERIKYAPLELGGE